ncbi:MAG TPA: hypothetical protein VM165_11760 [Planctomycetaceae bacterium]|nr:hypothetical protein [Planctomycetaceae bacterium]
MTLEDILDEIVLQEAEPNYQALTRWCERYPEHQAALAEFFATWGIQEEQSDVPAIDEDVVASRMVSHALNLLHSQPVSSQAQESAVVDTRLHKMVQASGLSYEAFVTGCGLDRSLLAKLDRHLIVATSIPEVCIQRLSQALKCAREIVVRAISGNPMLLLSHKAKGKPVARQETFLDAVATSDLSDSAKQEWQRIVAGEELH